MRRFFKGIISKSYSRRIRFMFVLFILLPTITLTVLNYHSDKQNISEKVDFYNETIVDVIANDVEKLLNDLIFSSHFILQDQGFREALIELNESSSIQSLSAFHQLEYIKERFLSIETRTLNQNISMYYENDEGLIVTSRNIPLSQGEIEAQWSEVSDNLNRSQEMMIQYLGKAEGSDTLDYHYFSRMIPRTLDSTRGSILTIVVSDEYFLQLFEAVSAGSIMLTDDQENFIAGERVKNPKDGDLLVRNITPLQWTLTYQTPNQQINEELNQSFYSSLMIIALFFMLFLFLSIKSAQRLSRPVEELKTLADEFGNGNRDVRFDVTGEDEIQKLGTAVNHMLDEINDLIQRIELKESQKRKLELHALSEQIRPHFLINTLNSLRCNLELEGDEFHSKKLYSLNMLLRKYLEIHEQSTLQNEVELLTHYLDIMEMRKGRSYWLKAWLAEEVQTLQMPFLTLQPLVENAILHAFDDPEVHPIISIRAEMEDDYIMIDVSDNGSGMSTEQVNQLNASLEIADFENNGNTGDSVGLINITQRLKMTISEQVKVVVRSEAGQGTTIRIVIPVSAIKAGDS